MAYQRLTKLSTLSIKEKERQIIERIKKLEEIVKYQDEKLQEIYRMMKLIY